MAVKKRLLLLAVLAALLGGCSPGPKPNELQFWTIQLSPKFDPLIRSMLAEWEEQNPGVSVRWTDLPFGSVERKLLAAVFARTAPDVVNLNPLFSANLASKGGLLPLQQRLTPEVKAFYLPRVLKAAEQDGELYALVTDSGYQDEPDVVWEVLGGARDGTFANSEFRPFEPLAEGAGAASPTTQTASALPDTFLRAAPSTTEPASSPTSDEKSDYAVALELQAQFEEEERLALRALRLALLLAPPRHRRLARLVKLLPFGVPPGVSDNLRAFDAEGRQLLRGEDQRHGHRVILH